MTCMLDGCCVLVEDSNKSWRIDWRLEYKSSPSLSFLTFWFRFHAPFRPLRTISTLPTFT